MWLRFRRSSYRDQRRSVYPSAGSCGDGHAAATGDSETVRAPSQAAGAGHFGANLERSLWADLAVRTQCSAHTTLVSLSVRIVFGHESSPSRPSIPVSERASPAERVACARCRKKKWHRREPRWGDATAALPLWCRSTCATVSRTAACPRHAHRTVPLARRGT